MKTTHCGNDWPALAARPCRRLRRAAATCAAFLAVTALSAPATAAGGPAAAVAPPSPPSSSLSFRIDQGNEINAFLREGDIAAQLVVRSGSAPRLIVAFPAGDSGIGLWLRAPAGRSTHWRLLQPPRVVRTTDGQGRTLRGLQADLEADSASLQIDQALLSSIRVLRNYQGGTAAPRPVLTSPRIRDDSLVWARDRLDGGAGFRLRLQVRGGAHVETQRLEAAPGQHVLQLRLTALSGEAPLTALGREELLRTTAAPDARERRILAFLSYREKFLAGAWRFDTYFGRDTLFSLMLLAPVLQRPAMIDGIDSVLARLSPDGEVAHEEAIGEYAILLNQAAGRGAQAAPVYDYHMVDEDFLLAPLMARWLLDRAMPPRTAAALLVARDPQGTRRGDALLRNLRYVVLQTAAFARQPTPSHLIGLKPGQRAGDWRDSDDGLDGGRYPFDVNVVFVPAALQAIQRLLDSGLLQPYLSNDDARLLAQAATQRRTWREDAAPLFRMRIGRSAALASLQTYAHTLGVDPRPAIAAVKAPSLTYQALSLDAAGHALPIMHSDEAFELLLDEPEPAALSTALQILMSPFPAGLMTPIGLLVANPAFADADTQQRFTRNAYHGTVVWAWQQAVLLAGIDRQLRRANLPAPLRRQLVSARTLLRHAIDRAGAFRGSELWSWSVDADRYRLQPFRPSGSGDAESDAAQLWSTVFLALRAH